MAAMGSDAALLIVDVQCGAFTPPVALYEPDHCLANMRTLLDGARTAGAPVVYVRHESVGGPLAPSSPGRAIHPRVAPRAGELVIDKRHNDGFHETPLHSELRRLGVSRLVVAGLQTEFCVDTTCRRAYSLGYRVTLVGDAHTTWDTEVLPAALIIAHHNRTLGQRLARVASTRDVIW